MDVSPSCHDKTCRKPHILFCDFVRKGARSHPWPSGTCAALSGQVALWRGGEVRRRFEGASPAPASMLAAHDLQLYAAGDRSSVVAVRALHRLSSCTPLSLRLSETFPDVL